VLQAFQLQAPGFCKAHAVALGTGAPHGGTFGAIQHAKLNHGFIGNYTAVAPQGVYFADNLTLSHPPHSGVAGHLTNGLHVHGNQQGTGSQACGCGGGFASGMASANYNDIKTLVLHGIDWFGMFHVERCFKTRIRISSVPRGTLHSNRNSSLGCSTWNMLPQN